MSAPMNRVYALNFHQLPAVDLQPKATSYFSAPEDSLDPRLFDEHQQMHTHVHNDLMGRFDRHMRSKYAGWQDWAKVWLAGSGASYQWSAARDPGDLDMLVGIDYPNFRYHNHQYTGLSDTEISQMITDGFREHLNPETANWSPDGENHFEVTWYSNPKSTDIRSINPYAAYEVGSGDWTVPPDPRPFQVRYSAQSDADLTKAGNILRNYNQSRESLTNPNLRPPLREEHEKAVKNAMEQASALFEDIHSNRHNAFVAGGKGYSDPANVRWQTGKLTGAVPALGELHRLWTEYQENSQVAMYGVSLPSADDLLLRSVLHGLNDR